MTLIELTLRDRNSGVVSKQHISPMRECWRRDPEREISEWIDTRGNPRSSNGVHAADLECLSYLVLCP